MVTAVLGGPPLVQLNRRGPPGVTLRLTGARANRDGAGTIVKANGQAVYATTSGSYLSANDGQARGEHLAGRRAADG